MVKLVVKLAIVAVLANALFRVGTEYVTYVRFRDAMRDAAMFKAATDEDLHRRIMDLSAEYEIPLSGDAFTIRREERRVLIDGSYRKQIEVAPTMNYAWPFSWSIDVITSTTIPATPQRR